MHVSTVLTNRPGERASARVIPVESAIALHLHQ